MSDLFFGVCILVDYWNLKGLEFEGTNNYKELDIISILSSYFLKQKGPNKFKETFKFYVKNSNMKMVVLTQLFRAFYRIADIPPDVDLTTLETEKEKDEERERQKKAKSKSKSLSNAFMEMIVTFIHENMEFITIRQYILENLTPMIKKKMVSFEPYFQEYLKAMLKFIGLNHSLNLFDMSFIMAVINNSNFDVNTSFSILESLLNLFFLSIPQARFLLMCISQILRKIPKNDVI